MQLKIGDKVRILTTGDDRIDWAAGAYGEIIDMHTVRDYLYGVPHPKLLQAEYVSITVATPLGNVTLNDNEVIAL